jgi:hypothetical protein
MTPATGIAFGRGAAGTMSPALARWTIFCHPKKALDEG